MIAGASSMDRTPFKQVNYVENAGDTHIETQHTKKDNRKRDT